jgi:hypothetical protein
MKTEMSAKTLKIFFFISVLLFVLGFVMVFYYNKTYAKGILIIGAMWTLMSFGQMMRLKRKHSE